ncbi:MAG: AAA family ATPase [Phormidesmis sp.]
MTWKYFHGNQETPTPLTTLPERPPWRDFLPFPDDKKKEENDDTYWKALRELAQQNDRAMERGRSFQIQTDTNGYSDIIDAVNAAIHLRRPLLVTGTPGSGKTSLAYAIAYELALGPVLVWPITARANLADALYQYDVIARLQDAQLDQTRRAERREQTAAQKASEADGLVSKKAEGDLGDYIRLGPVGTAFLPSRLPRVLLIDEIDKSDLNLPNDLLNLFEEGEFELPELIRQKRVGGDKEQRVTVRTADKNMPEKQITGGRIRCCEFPIVIMTSNGERDFPPAFYRRCLRVSMPRPTAKSLEPVVKSHFKNADATGWLQAEDNLTAVIKEFLGKDNRADRATDQLLNAVYLMTREEKPNEKEMERLKKLLFKQLGESS